jgi:hypothetical protein
LADSVVFAREGVILNPCCLINLYASRYLSKILEALQVPVMVAADVCEHEELMVYGEGLGEEGLIPEKIEVKPLLDAGLLTTARPSSDAELISVINFAFAVKEDGEAFTAALALHHHWAVGIDDSRTISFLRRNIPSLKLFTTPHFVKQWIDRTSPTTETIRTVLHNIQWYAKYTISPHHALYAWWHSYLDS